jgi:hypothetical protein
MLLAGFGVIAWGLFIGYVLGYPSWITDTLGLFNILLGIITPRSRKVELQPEPSGAVKLVVDKVMFRHGKWRFSDYELVFLDNRLVMKKLFSWKPIVILGGFFGGVGGLIGGVTGFSVQEFLDQRKRDKIRARNEFMTVARGDVEVPYDSMSQVRLTGIDLRMVVGGRLLVFSMGAEYPPLMARRVRNLIPNECWVLPPLH